MTRCGIIGLLCCVGAVGCSAADPFAFGLHEFDTVEGKTATAKGTNITWNYVAKVPKGVGEAPVLVWVTGWGGVLPSETYDELSTMFAMKGVASVVLWRLAGPQPGKDGRSLVEAMTYLRQNLVVNINWDVMSVGGHSAGNHVWCDYLQDACSTSVKGVVMMDPVDGYDPFGIVNNYCTSTTAKLNYTLPALLMSTGLDPVPGPQGVPCAPENMSNTRFYNAWSGPIWMVNATSYGHLDVCDPEIEVLGEIICAADTNPRLEYKRQVTGLTKAFFDLLTGSPTTTILTNVTAMPVASIATSTHNGVPPPYAGGCHYV